MSPNIEEILSNKETQQKLSDLSVSSLRPIIKSVPDRRSRPSVSAPSVEPSTPKQP